MKMNDRMKAMLTEVPVWPEEAVLVDICRKHHVGIANIPTDVCIGENGGRVCWFSQKIKDRFLREVNGEVN